MTTSAPAPVSFEPPDRAAVATGTGLLQRVVPATWLMMVVVGWLIADMLLLWRFLDFASPWLYAASIVPIVLICRTILKSSPDPKAGPGVGTVLICVAVAAALLMVGGEGRFFYANLDWQVRDAVLRDLATQPWPFAYATPDGPAILRAPLGMYLVPAIAGKLWGQTGSDLGLLIQNSLLLGTLFAIGSTLFDSARTKAAALGIFLAFSGLDILGVLLTQRGQYLTPTAHLETWMGSQYSSTVTLAFWVPQHAMAGWIGALWFLLWRAGRLRIGALSLTLPLLTLWSPLSAMGLLPFFVFAGLSALIKRKVSMSDIAATAAAITLVIPALLYLGAAGDSVGARIFPLPPMHYAIFEAIEVLPWMLVVARAGWSNRFGGATFVVMALCLLLMPYGQIGWGTDFAMRASIPALAILAVQVADVMTARDTPSARRVMIFALLAIGGVTGMTETMRGLTFPVSERPRCPLIREWDKTTNFKRDSAGYLALLDHAPPKVRPVAPRMVTNLGPAMCETQPWKWPALFSGR